MIIRRANINDVKTYWNWFNDIEVKKNSFNYKKTSFKNHYKWFEEKINNKNNYLYIGLIKNHSCSQIRIELKGNEYILSYSVDKNYRMQGIGKRIVAITLRRLSKLKNFKKLPIIAKVKKENIYSIKIFDFLKFEKRKFKDYFLFKKNLN